MAKRQTRRGWGKIQAMRSGRFQAGYTGPDMARHYAPNTFTSRMDAEFWLASERRLIERQEWTPPALRNAAASTRGMPFGQYALADLEQRVLKPRTRKGYRELIEGPLSKFHKTPINQITPESVRVWFTGLRTATPTKNAHAYRVLRTILNTAVADGLIKTNPAMIRGAGQTETKHRATILEPVEIDKLALAMPALLQAAVLIMGWCGLRWGELIGLTRADISPDCSEIFINRAIGHRDAQCLVDVPKTGDLRSVITPPHIRGALADHLEHFVSAESDAVLFKADKSCHYSERVFKRAYLPALKSIGRSGVRIHDLRHTAGTQAARVGTIRDGMDRLGHSNISTAMRYQGLADGSRQQVAEKLSGLVAPEG